MTTATLRTWASNYDAYAELDAESAINLAAPKGPGEWVGYIDYGGKSGNVQWVHRDARGFVNIPGLYAPASPVPELIRPENQRRSCGCRQREHTCTNCGLPYWVESHGNGYGECTYCYALG